MAMAYGLLELSFDCFPLIEAVAGTMQRRRAGGAARSASPREPKQQSGLPLSRSREKVWLGPIALERRRWPGKERGRSSRQAPLPSRPSPSMWYVRNARVRGGGIRRTKGGRHHRLSDYESGGQEFESLRARQYDQRLTSISQAKAPSPIPTGAHVWAHITSGWPRRHP
jgi:hypothetical protein